MDRLDPASFRARYGPWALVAGGSEGIGAAFARAAAVRGLHCLLVAERPDPLEAFARSLARDHGVEVRTAVVDLARPDGAARLAPHAEGLEVGLLVCNAAVSWVGRFLDEPAERLAATVDLNCRAVLMLAHAHGRAMAARGRGGIVLMSSLAGRQGTALVAGYAASKAFAWVLGESLWDELRDEGVDVLALCAGATRTPGLERNRPRFGGGLLKPPLMEPDAVVAEALSALGRRPSHVAGRANRLAASLLDRWLPRRFAVATMGRQMRAQYPERARRADPRSASPDPGSGD